MADSLQCKHCGKPVRAHAKFCPHCGEKTGVSQGTGILSFDDFFDEESEKIREEEPITAEPEAEEDTPMEEAPADGEETTPEAETEEAPRTIFTFRDREKRRKVKMLEDTLELPIEEIQREIARRRERERLELRSPEEKQAEKEKMAAEFDKLKEQHGDAEVLIPESEILQDGDRQEKKSLFSRARDYLLGIDVEDIEGVDVKAEEAREHEKVDRILYGKSDVSDPEGVEDAYEPEIVSPPIREAAPKPEEEQATLSDEKETEDSIPVLSVPTRASREKIQKTTWFGTLFDRKRDRTEEEMVISPFDSTEEAAETTPFIAGEEEDTPNDPAAAEQKRRRRNWILAGAAALLVVLGVGLFMAGNYMSDPQRLTESFASAIESEDTRAIAGMLHADGTQVTEESLAPFFAMLENPEYKATLLSHLNDYNEGEGRSKDADVWIEESGSRYFFFNAHRMHVKTFYVTPTVTYPNTQVAVDGKDPVVISPDASVAIGPLLPGAHQITGVYEEGLNPIHSTATVELTTANEDMEGDALAIDLSNPGSFATFSSPQEEAVLLLDGQDMGKVKDLGEDLRFGPFESPVKVQLRLDTPIGSVLSEEKNADVNGAALDFTFGNMVEISDYHDEATIILNGTPTTAKGKDFIPYGRLIGPVKPEDTLQMEMEVEGRQTKSNVVTVGDNDSLRFSYWKTFTFPWKFSDAIVTLDGEDTGQSVYQLAGDDMSADLLNSYETIKLTKKYPWGTFESNTLSLEEAGSLNFTMNPINSTLYRQLQDAVVRHLEEDAFAISNLKPDNYSNIEDPLLSERRAFIQNLIDEKERIVRVSETANFDMNSIQFDDEDTYYARITETYVYKYQEYEAGIFRPIRLEMMDAREVMQHALRYDKSAGKWMIYDNRPKDSMGQDNIESIDLAY